MMQEPGVDSVTTWVGSGVPRFYLPLDQIFPQSNVSQAIVLPKDLAAREALRMRLPAAAGRASSPRCAAASSCCPTGRRCRTRCSSASSAPTRRRCAPGPTEAKAMLRANPNMRGVNDNWNESVKVLRLEIDQDKARALGVTSQAIAQASRTILSGSTIGQYREGDKLIDIVLRQPLGRAQRASPTWPTPTCPPPAAAPCR